VPFKGSRVVNVKYGPDIKEGTAVTLSFEGSQTEVGFGTAATLSITGSGPVTLNGLAQTAPANAKWLHVVAKTADGTIIGRSGGFSVCSHIDPESYTMTGVDNNVLRGGWGFDVAEKWGADSGPASDLKECWKKEVVTERSRAAPWMPINTSTDDFGPANKGTRIDQHITPVGGLEKPVTHSGDYIKNQNHVFYCKRCGMIEAGAVLIPAPFVITRSCTKNGEEYVVVVKKEGKGGPLSSTEQAASVPNAPSDFKVVPIIDKDKNSIKWTLTWKDNSKIEGNFYYEYKPVRKTHTNTAPKNAVTATTTVAFVWSDLKGKIVTFKLQAINWKGESLPVTFDCKVPSE
jgi:hypothetical protein